MDAVQRLQALTQGADGAARPRGWGIHPFYASAPPGTEPAEGPASAEGEAGGEEEERAAPGVAFELSAPTAARNAYRVLRALTLRKAVLLEGSPGVGKTALVAALARRAGVPLVSGGSGRERWGLGLRPGGA